MSRTVKVCLGFGVLLLLALGLWFSTVPRASRPQVATAPYNTPPSSEIAVPVAQNPLKWGGALNSVSEKGAFFSDRARRNFISSINNADAKYVVDLNARAFLPDRAAFRQVFADLKSGPRTAYLQFYEHPTAQQRETLRAHGIEVLSYVSGYAWNARGTSADFEAAQQFDFVRAVASVDARDKLQPEIYAGRTPAYAVTAASTGEQTHFMVLTTPGLSAESLKQAASQVPALADAQIQPWTSSVLGPRFEVVATRAAALDIAALDAVTFVEFVPPPVASRDATSDLESNIADVRDHSPSLTGAGVSVAIRELGKQASHVDFISRLQFITAGSNVTADVDHATAVTGQIGSSGSSQPSAKGVAPAVQMLGYAVPSTGTATFSSADVVDAASKGARISNHSYGPTGLSTFGDYQTISADWDNAIRSSNLLGMFAGNEEPGQTTNHIDFFVGAKNTICVAATSSQARAGDDNPPVAQSDGISSFSQFGPMKDGRIKPDLVAFGEFVTLDQGTNSTQNASGTSFSTPVVTGCAALVDQAYKAVVGVEPSGALMKALLCNSATDLGNKGPDVMYGFGIVNVKAAVNTIALQTSTANSPFFEGTLTNGQSTSFTLSLSGTPQLKTTLVWMDVSGNPAAAKALVNDLDLTLIDPNGVTHFPYSINPAAPLALATNTGPNTVDPIEQCIIDTPMDGTWTVKINATSIPSGSQPFAVCVNVPRQPVPLVALIQASPTEGDAPLTVAFTSQGSAGAITSYIWDFGDGNTDTSNVPSLSHTYTTIGTFIAKLTLTDTNNKQATASVTIKVDKPHPSTFATRLQANVKFPQAQKDRMSVVLTARNLVKTAQQSREALRDGTFEGVTVKITINNLILPNIQNAPPIVLDRKASYKSTQLSVKHNFPKGQIVLNFNKQDLAQIFDQPADPATGKPAVPASDPASTGSRQVAVTVETTDAIYQATFTVLYKSTGKSGNARN